MAGRYHLITFGCQMNSYDSEKMEGLLAKTGMAPAGSPEEADVIILNTCSIREKAESKVFSKLGRLAEIKNGSKLIAVGGCMASLRKEDIFRRAPSVDVVFGPDALERLPQLLVDARATRKRQMDVAFAETTVWDEEAGDRRSNAVSARVGIMKGCDNHCTYCVVPSTRGPEVSRPVDSVLAEVRALAEKGYKEINLIGQNVNSYGKGTDTDFPALLEMVADVDGIERIRFMTSHPKDLSGRLIEVMAREKKVCPAFHLPLQAGADRILAMMNRGYTSAEYLAKVEKLKDALPGIALSTDIMVGFPTETEEEFQRTFAAMEEVRFDSLFLFNYSPRPGTSAESMDGMIPREVSQSRFDRAYALHKSIVAEKLGRLVGAVQEVLCEGMGNGGRWTGRTPENHLVFFDGVHADRGALVPVTITAVLGYNLSGTASAEGKKWGKAKIIAG